MPIVALTGSNAVAASPSGFPVTIHAANGLVHINSEPHAIVSMSPTATEMLYAIGAGRQVKGVDSYSDFPANAPRTKLDAYQPNVEAIVAFKPDLVIVSGDTTGITQALGTFGIPVLSTPAATDLNDEYKQFTEIGAATGHKAAAAAEVSKIKSQIRSIVASVGTQARGKTYYYELEQTYYSVTSSTFIGQVLGLLGLKNIADAAQGAAASGGYPQLTAEFIIKANPNYIFLADTICCAQNVHTVAARPGWSTMRAVTGHHVVDLNDDVASRWGPRIVNLLSIVAAAVRTRH